MSNKRYIELYSGNRDRTRFPDMAYFEVELNKANNYCTPGSNSGLIALDPIGIGLPIRTFFLNSQVNGFNQSNPTGPFPQGCGSPYYTNDLPGGTPSYSGAQSGVIESGVVPAIGNINFPPVVQNCVPETLSTVPNYYNGYLIENCQTGTVFNPQSINPIGGQNEFRIINGYNNSTANFTTTIPFSSQFTGPLNTSYALYDSSLYLDSNVVYNPTSLPKMNIQYKDAFSRFVSDRFGDYTSYYIYNHYTNEYRTIKEYDPELRIISYDNTFNLMSNPPFTNGYGSYYLGVSEQSYAPAFSIRQKLPAESGYTISLVPGTTNKFFTTSPAPNGSYIGNFIYILPQPNDPILSTVSTLTPMEKMAAYAFQIKDWTDGIITILGCVNLSNYANGNLDNRLYEVIQFTKDNYSSLNYSGSMVSQNEVVCYEIELISLILPNVTLTTGSRLAFYPYVLVEFQNISSPMNSSKNIIYSNNPNTTNALFICPINDTTNPLISSFVKIDSAGMTQTVKFKPNDSLRFKVYLPNGELFKPVQDDNMPPYPPINYLQIEAVFSVKRL